jgi:hypothetical protein
MLQRWRLGITKAVNKLVPYIFEVTAPNEQMTRNKGLHEHTMKYRTKPTRKMAALNHY